MRRLRALRTTGDQPYVCAVNAEELERGTRHVEANALTRLLDGVVLAPLGRDEGARAGRWRREHAVHGVTPVAG